MKILADKFTNKLVHIFYVALCAGLALSLSACGDTMDDGGQKPNPKFNEKPTACLGSPVYSSVFRTWESTSDEMTLTLKIYDKLTNMQFGCDFGDSSYAAGKTVASSVNGEQYIIQSTGTIVVGDPNSKESCELADIGGAYDIKFAGRCLVLSNDSEAAFYLIAK